MWRHLFARDGPYRRRNRPGWHCRNSGGRGVEGRLNAFLERREGFENEIAENEAVADCYEVKMTSLRRTHKYQVVYCNILNNVLLFVVPFATLTFLNYETAACVLGLSRSRPAAFCKIRERSTGAIRDQTSKPFLAF